MIWVDQPKIWIPPKPAIIRKATFPFPTFVPAVSVATLSNSVMMNGASQYLSRTSAASVTNNLKWTASFFFKRNALNNNNILLADGLAYQGDCAIGFCIAGSGPAGTGAFMSVDQLMLGPKGQLTPSIATNNQYQSTTTWVHCVIAVDTTQATAANRARIYSDGIEVIYNSGNVPPTQNAPVGRINNAGGVSQVIGCYNFTGAYYVGKIADVYFIDGQQLTPSAFTVGTGSGTTHPGTYVGTYGLNGFHLSFSAANYVDSSGNGANWAQSGSPTFSTDVPT